MSFYKLKVFTPISISPKLKVKKKTNNKYTKILFYAIHLSTDLDLFVSLHIRFSALICKRNLQRILIARNYFTLHQFDISIYINRNENEFVLTPYTDQSEQMGISIKTLIRRSSNNVHEKRKKSGKYEVPDNRIELLLNTEIRILRIQEFAPNHLNHLINSFIINCGQLCQL